MIMDKKFITSTLNNLCPDRRSQLINEIGENRLAEDHFDGSEFRKMVNILIGYLLKVEPLALLDEMIADTN